MAVRAWASIALDWYEDPVLDVIADERPEVFSLWPVLVAMCTGVSHVQKNPRGRLEVSVGRLARAIRVDKATISELLSHLEKGELIVVEIDGPSLVIELVRFSKWQKPKGSKAKWMRDNRADVCRENDAEGGTSVNISGTSVTLPVPIPIQEISLSKDNSPKTEPVSGLSKSLEKKRQQENQITEVLEHWQTVFNHQSRAITGKAAAKRRSRVKARLVEGFTVDQLKQALEGQSKREVIIEGGHTDVITVLRDGPQVELGIDVANTQSGSEGREITLEEIQAMRKGERTR